MYLTQARLLTLIIILFSVSLGRKLFYVLLNVDQLEVVSSMLLLSLAINKTGTFGQTMT